MHLDITFITVLHSFGLFIYFIFATFVALFLPGRILLRKYVLSFDPFVRFVLYLSFGLVLWSLQGFLFGFFGMRFLTYGYIGIFLILSFSFLIKLPTTIIKFCKSYKIWSVSLIAVFIVGMFGQLLQPGVCGFVFNKGWYCLVDDTVWHMGLTSGLVHHFPPFEPGMTGYVLKNYHFLGNLFIAEFIRVFHMPLLPTQFIFSYSIVSFLVGGLTYVLSKFFKFSREGVTLAVFLQYFSSDIIYLVTLISKKTMEFTVHPLDDGMMMLENPPRAFSIIVALLAVALFTMYLRNPSIGLGVIAAVVAGSVIGFKIHTGFMVLCGFCGYSVYLLLKREWRYFFVPILALVISLCIYLPFNAGAGFPVYAPFEMSRMFVVQPKLELITLELRRRVYSDHFNTLRVLQMDLIMLLVFLIAQFGLRVFGLLGFKAVSCASVPLTIFLGTGLFGSFLVGTLFVQPVANADIFNFYLAGSFCLFILMIFLFNHWIKKMNIYVKAIFIFIVLIMTIPRWVYKMRYYLNRYDGLSPTVNSMELKALDFLKRISKPNDIVFVMNNQGQFDGWRAYVTALSERGTFLSGRGYLLNQKIDIDARENVVNILFTSTDNDALNKVIIANKLKYLYFYHITETPSNMINLPITEIFHNDMVTIFRYENL